MFKQPSGKQRFAVMNIFFWVPIALGFFLWHSNVSFTIAHEGWLWRWDPTGWLLLFAISLLYATWHLNELLARDVSDQYADELDRKPCRTARDEFEIPPLFMKSGDGYKVIHGPLAGGIKSGLSSPGTSGTIWDGIDIHPKGSLLEFGDLTICNSIKSLRTRAKVDPHIRDKLLDQYGDFHPQIPIRYGVQLKYPLLTREIMREIIDAVRVLLMERKILVRTGIPKDPETEEEHEIIEVKKLTDHQVAEMLTPEFIADAVGVEMAEKAKVTAYDYNENEKRLNRRIDTLEVFNDRLLDMLERAGVAAPKKPDEPFREMGPGAPEGQPPPQQRWGG